MNTNSHTVYKLTDITNNKIYIGTSIQFSSRLSQHKYCQKHSNNTLIGNAIFEKGWANFKVDILAMVDTQEQADFLEKKYIAEYNSNDSEFGYNKNHGSRGTVKGTPKSEIHRLNMSKAATGKHKSKEHRKHMAEARIGRSFPRNK